MTIITTSTIIILLYDVEEIVNLHWKVKEKSDYYISSSPLTLNLYCRIYLILLNYTM